MTTHDPILDCGHRPCDVCGPAELADPARFCPTCGANILGNDPHEPGCETGGEA